MDERKPYFWPLATRRMALFKIAFSSGRSPPSLPHVEAAVAHVPAHSVVWTESWLGPWAYRFPVMGTDTSVLQGLLLDPLPSLWMEGRAHGDSGTALLVQTPTSNFFADVLAEAYRAGYRTTYRSGDAVVVAGTQHFRVATPFTTPVGQEPLGLPWEIPLWTKTTRLGMVDWKTGALGVPLRAGRILLPFAIWLKPGRYVLALGVSSPSAARGIDLGRFAVQGAVEGEAPIVGGSSSIQLPVDIMRPTALRVVVTSTGRLPFAVYDLTVSR